MPRPKVFSVAMALAILSTPVSAADRPVIQILDFIVDWQDYIGKEVIITGGAIALASNDNAMLSSDAGQVALSAPWPNREDLRYVLKYCSGVDRGPACRRPVGGTVVFNKHMPELKGIRLGNY